MCRDFKRTKHSSTTVLCDIITYFLSTCMNLYYGSGFKVKGNNATPEVKNRCDEIRPYSVHLLFFGLPSHRSISSTIFQVRVVIVDENDCIPEFLQSIYSKDGVPETVTTATSLLQGEMSVLSKVPFKL